VALGQVNFAISETGITGTRRMALGLVALGQVNFGITESGITGVHTKYPYNFTSLPEKKLIILVLQCNYLQNLLHNFFFYS
jgi:hypothetical protein